MCHAHIAAVTDSRFLRAFCACVNVWGKYQSLITTFCTIVTWRAATRSFAFSARASRAMGGKKKGKRARRGDKQGHVSGAAATSGRMAQQNATDRIAEMEAQQQALIAAMREAQQAAEDARKARDAAARAKEAASRNYAEVLADADAAVAKYVRRFACDACLPTDCAVQNPSCRGPSRECVCKWRGHYSNQGSSCAKLWRCRVLGSEVPWQGGRV